MSQNDDPPKKKYYLVTYPTDRMPPWAKLFELFGNSKTFVWRWISKKQYVVSVNEGFYDVVHPGSRFGGSDAVWKELESPDGGNGE